MIRTPLRPLARILDARAQGMNPKGIERENLRKQAIAKAQAEDAADIPAITGGAEDAEKAEQAAIDAAVVAGLNKKVERQLAARN